MDQKTLDALSLMQVLTGQIRFLSENARGLSATLSDGSASVYLDHRFAGNSTIVRNTGEFYPVLCLNDAERAEIVAILERYLFRLDSILSGCSIKLSQGLKEIVAEQEATLEDLRRQALALQAGVRKQ